MPARGSLTRPLRRNLTRTRHESDLQLAPHQELVSKLSRLPLPNTDGELPRPGQRGGKLGGDVTTGER